MSGVKFAVQEKLTAYIEFEIKNAEQDVVEEALDDIGDCLSADDLYMKLQDRFGIENVVADGVGDVDNISPADECEFWDWVK